MSPFCFKLTLKTSFLILTACLSSACATNQHQRMDHTYPHNNPQFFPQWQFAPSAHEHTNANIKSEEEHFLLYSEEKVAIEANGITDIAETQAPTYYLLNFDQANLISMLSRSTDQSSEYHRQPCWSNPAQVDLYTARIRFNKTTEVITDDNAFNLFNKVSQNSQAQLEDRALAEYCMAFMRFEYRTEKITDNDAFNLFNKVSQNSQAQLEDRALAEYCMAFMRFTNRTHAISDNQAIALLDNLYSNDSLKQELRLSANALILQLLKRLPNSGY